MLYFEKGLYTSTYMSLFYPFLINLLLVLKKKTHLTFFNPRPNDSKYAEVLLFI